MTRSPKRTRPAVETTSSPADTDAVVQIKVWLLGISPMVWRRVLVPRTCTLYGDVQLASPRLHRCAFQSTDGPAAMSPLRNLIPGQIAPERLHLEARWSSLVPYAAAAELLADVLPITSGANRTTVREGAARS